MVGFETGAAHGEEGIGGGAVEAAVFEVGGVVGCGGMLAVDAFAGEGGAGLENFVFRGMNEADAVLFGQPQDLLAAHGLADGDALGDGGRGGDGRGLRGPLRRGAQKRVAVLALQGDDLREMVDDAAILQVLERVDRAEEERAVAHGDDEVGGDAAELLEDLIDIGLRALVEEGVIDVVCVIDALLLDLCAADVGAVVARAGDDGAGRAVGADHVDLLGARALGHEDLAGDARLGAVGRNGVARVAAGILHNLIDTDRLAVRDQHSRAAVFEGKGGHEVVHFEQHVLVQTDDRGHALAHGDGAPALVLQRHELPVAEEAPFVRVDAGEVKRGQIGFQFPQAAAGAVGGAGGDGLFAAASGADKVHIGSSLSVFQFSDGFDLDQCAVVQRPGGDDDAGGLMAAEEGSVDRIDLVPEGDIGNVHAAEDHVFPAAAGGKQDTLDVVQGVLRLLRKIRGHGCAGLMVDRELAGDIERLARDHARDVMPGVGQLRF